MLTEDRSLAEKSALYLALLTAFCLTTHAPKSPHEASKHEMVRLLSFDQEMLPEAVALSNEIGAARDEILGPMLCAVYDLKSIAAHYGVPLALVQSAVSLLGAMPIHNVTTGKTVWAEGRSANVPFGGEDIARAGRVVYATVDAAEQSFDRMIA